MAPAKAPVAHRSTSKHSHKSFKSRHATKSQIKDLLKGKVETERGKRSRKPLHQQVMSKIERRHQSRQQRQNKQREHAQSTSVFAGKNGAPRIVTILSLTEDIDIDTCIRSLSSSLDIETDFTSKSPCCIRVDRFKQRVQFVPAGREFFSSLDACQAADYIIVVLSPSQAVDEEGEQLLKTIESQGVSNVLTMVQGLEALEGEKRRTQVLSSLKLFISQFFPGQDKISSLGSIPECSNVMRSLCTSMPKGIHWRDDRSWMLVDEVRWDSGPDCNKAILTGVVRGRPLKANRLLNIGDWGEFQIEKIEVIHTDDRRHKTGEMALDEVTIELPDTDQDNQDELAPEDIIMEGKNDELPRDNDTERKGVLLDDHHYFEDETRQESLRPKRLPRGTSEYQAAWFLDEMSDSGSDMEEVEEGEDAESIPLPADGMEGLDLNGAEPVEGAPSEYPQSEMFQDLSPEDEAAELAEYRSSRKAAAKEDSEFPDEIELHPHVLARERLARYRGLKSLRTSRWETSEDRAYEPADWNRLLQVHNYTAARNQAMREALVGGVAPGTRVNIHVRNVPFHLQTHEAARTAAPQHRPLMAVSLLRHEHKRTAVHFSFTLRSDYPAPLASKTDLVVQCGPRRFVAKLIYSAAGTTPNDVHKFDRFLQPGRTAIASVVAPLTWGAVPTLFFTQTPVETSTGAAAIPPTLVATGSVLPPNTRRIVAKRIVLTGHPYRINRRLVTVRYMFFNAADVRWFAALPLWTRRGRSGFIKEPLGTHGQFKATFDGRINPQDSVGVSLYKRVWPRPARRWEATEVLAAEEARASAQAQIRTADGMVTE